jgi:hypothetical protein
MWKERAGKIKAGTPLEEVERILPIYWGPTHRIIVSDGMSITVPLYPRDFMPFTFSGWHNAQGSVQYHVTDSISVNWNYDQTNPNKPVSSIRVEHQPTLWDMEWQEALRANIYGAAGVLTFEGNTYTFIVPEPVSQVLESVSPDKLFAFFKVLANEFAISVSQSLMGFKQPDLQSCYKNLNTWSLIVKQHLHGHQVTQPDGKVMMVYNTQHYD